MENSDLQNNSSCLSNLFQGITISANGTDSTHSLFENVDQNIFYSARLYENNSKIEETILNISENKLQCPVENWTAKQIMKWVIDLYDYVDYNYEDINLQFFKNKNGSFFVNLREDDWKNVDYTRSKWLFKNAQELILTSNNKFHKNSIEKWNSNQIMDWILSLCDKANYQYEDICLHYLKERDGCFLINLSESDWEKIAGERAKWFYDNVQQLIKNSNILSEKQNCLNSSDEEVTIITPKRKRGRPRTSNQPKPQQKIGYVWEFLRDLLLNPLYCPKIICWEDNSSYKFRLIDANAVAKLWGEKKNNPTMNYEKFSRSIRHNYKKNIIESVEKINHVYQFGKNAHGIDTHNRNFEKKNC